MRGTLRVAIVFILYCVFAMPAMAAIPIRADKSHGPLKTTSGVAMSALTSDGVRDAIRFLGSGGLFKLEQPSTETLNSSLFSQMVSSGLIPYVSFTDGSSASSFGKAYAQKYPGKKLYVELYSRDAGAIKSLASQLPEAEVHGGGIWYIHRENMRDMNQSGVWSAMKAMTIRLKPSGSDVFKDANLMLDTLFDAQKDIDGGTGIKMNFPSGAQLAVSEITTGTDEKGMAMTHSVMSAMIATSVQGGSAPLRFVIVNNYDKLSAGNREIIGRLLGATNTHPTLAWPDAFGGNGDPYDNPFSDQWNTEPVMGVALSMSGGKWFHVVNTSGRSVSADLKGAQGNYQYLSSNGTKGTIGSSTISLAPYESRLVAPSFSNAPAPSIPTDTPANPTQTPTSAPQEPGSTVAPRVSLIPTSVPRRNNTYSPTVAIQNPIQHLSQAPQNPFAPEPSTTVQRKQNISVNTVALAKKVDKTLQAPLRTYDKVRYYDTVLQFRMQLWWQKIVELFIRE